jgi:para-aminobenzoate synthetase/4-amino-4-deoxychorismate lyase
VRFIFDFAHSPAGILRRVFDNPVELLSAHTIEEVQPLLLKVEQASERGLYAAGFISYEAAPAFDIAATVKSATGKLPLALFGLFESPHAGFTTSESMEECCSPWQLDTDFNQYQQQIDRIREAIQRGDSYQINHTLRAHSHLKGSGYALYQRLRQGQEARYCAWLDCDKFQILSLSPELFFQRTENKVITRPMKGTARRGEMPEEDQALAQWLQESRKNRAENLMIVDLLRNDLSRLSQPGRVNVPELFTIERYPTVLQMTSTVEAEIKPDTTLPQLFSALFPCGSITGAPKLKSMEIIAQLEGTPRGVYCGAVGFVEPGGNATFNVAIRTLTLNVGSGALECGLGGGITWDSVARDEYEEVKIKAGFLTRTQNKHSLIETLRLDDGVFAYAKLHLDRLKHSAQVLGHSFDDHQTGLLMKAFATEHPKGRFRVRLLHSPSGQIFMEGFPLESNPAHPPRVVLAPKPVDSSNPTLFHKTTDRTVYEEALAHSPPDVFDVLLWNERGELTEFTRGNLVMELEGQKYTPPVHCGLLPGVYRQHLLNQGEIHEKVLARNLLNQATGIWFINSVRDWIAVEIKSQ